MKHYIVFSLFAILGLFLIWVEAANELSPVFEAMTRVVGTTFLITGAMSVAQQALTDEENFRRLKALFKVHESIEKSGLVEIKPDFRDYCFKQLIAESKELFVLLQNGRSWLRLYEPEVYSRLERSDYCTTFLFVDPDGEYLDCLASKTETTSSRLSQKIKSTVQSLQMAYEGSSKAGKLKIYYLPNDLPQSIFLTDSKLVITPYFVSSGKRRTPLFIYEDSGSLGFFGAIRDDIDKLIAVSREAGQVGEEESLGNADL